MDSVFYLRFSQLWIWRVLSPRIYCRVVNTKSIYVSEEHFASNFRFEEYAEQETSVKQAASRACDIFVRNVG
jgi:hypothetical protein